MSWHNIPSPQYGIQGKGKPGIFVQSIFVIASRPSNMSINVLYVYNAIQLLLPISSDDLDANDGKQFSTIVKNECTTTFTGLQPRSAESCSTFSAVRNVPRIYEARPPEACAAWQVARNALFSFGSLKICCYLRA